MESINKLAEMVAKEFETEIKESDCENFTEMKEFYWWDSKDIRGEVDYMINKTYADMGWVMFDDSDILQEDETGRPVGSCTYRKFINMVYSILKAEGLYA